MDTQNELSHSSKDRREFVKKAFASSLTLSLLYQELFSYTNENTPDQGSDEQVVNKALMLKEAIDHDAVDEERYMNEFRQMPPDERPIIPSLTPNQRRQVIFAARYVQEIKNAQTPDQFRTIMERAERLVKDNDPRLSPGALKGLGEFLNTEGAENLKEKITYFELGSAGAALAAGAAKKPKVAFAAGTVGLMATAAKALIPDKLDYTPDPTKANKDMLGYILKKDAIDIIEQSKDRFTYTEKDRQVVKNILGVDIGLPLEDRMKNLQPEMRGMVEKALKKQTGELEKHIKDTAKLYHKKMVDYMEEKEQARQQNKKEAFDEGIRKEREHKETLAQMQVFGVLANRFLDEKTAKTVNTFMQVGLSVGSVLASPTTGPWQIGAAFLGGANAFGSLSGSAGRMDSKMKEYFIQIMQTLNEINGKLDKVLKNQRTILSKMEEYYKAIKDLGDFNHQEVMERLGEIQENMDLKDQQERYVAFISPLEKNAVDIVTDTKNKSSKEGDKLSQNFRVIQHLANTTSKQPTFSLSSVKLWNSDIAYKYMINGYEKESSPSSFAGRQINYKVNLIPFIQHRYFNKKDFTELQNPTLWAEAANVFTNASILATSGNKMITKGKVKEEISKGAKALYGVGKGINASFKNVINQEDINKLQEVCIRLIDEITKKTIEAAYDEYIESAKLLENEQIYASKLPYPITKEVIREIHQVTTAQDICAPSNEPVLVYSDDGYFDQYARGPGAGHWGHFAVLGGCNPIALAQRYRMIDLKSHGPMNRPANYRPVELSRTHPNPSILTRIYTERGYESGFYHSVKWRSKVSPHWYIKTDGNSKRGMRISKLIIEESALRAVPYYTCSFYYFSHRMLARGEETVPRNNGATLQIRKTKQFIDTIVDELPHHHAALRDEFKDKAISKFTVPSKEMRNLINDYNAAAQSLAFLAGFNHWYSGGSLEAASYIASDQKQLLTRKHALAELVSKLYYKTPDKVINGKVGTVEEYNMTAGEYLSQEFREAMHENIKSFTKTYFPEGMYAVEKPGFPEVNAALNNLAVLKKFGPKFYKHINRDLVEQTLPRPTSGHTHG